MDTAERKREIRQTISARFRLLTPEEREVASARICDKLMALPWWKDARVLSSFWPLGKEPDLAPALQEWIRLGKTLALPRVEGKNPEDVQLYRVADPRTDLHPGTLGIQEPIRDRCAPVDPANLDWIWVPGLAFDATGGRLGHGKGYYDSLLSRVPPRVLRIGIAYDFQIVPGPLPREPWDQALHAVVTDRRFLSISLDSVGG